MERIDLRITISAKRLILEYMELFDSQNHITCVLWQGSGNIFKESGELKEINPGWEVGWCSREKIEGAPTQLIEGIEFVFDQGEISKRLNGMVLDVEGKNFIVRVENEHI